MPSNLPDYLSQVERDIIGRALDQTQFNRTQAASLLGISVRQLRYQMQKLEIQTHCRSSNADTLDRRWRPWLHRP